MRRTTKLADTEDQINTLLESVVSIDTVFEKTTYEACERVLNETLGDTDTTTGTTETTRYADKTSTPEDTTSTSKNSLEGVADIESAFDDLLAS